MQKNYEELYNQISDILKNAKKQAKTAVNLSMVYAYFEIGHLIVEEEQNGDERAAYGKYLLKNLSEHLTEKLGKGYSVTNLKQMRQFYITYAHDQISQTLSDQFESLPTVSTGRKFSLVGRQVRFTFNEEHFWVDLVFYNRLLRCFVIFDLKIGELKHQDIGQMQMYVNYYDRKVKLEDENPTIGIVLCKDKNDAVVEMTLPEDNSQIFASKYQTVLPSKEELQRLLNGQE